MGPLICIEGTSLCKLFNTFTIQREKVFPQNNSLNVKKISH
jgi:hypothetical protein